MFVMQMIYEVRSYFKHDNNNGESKLLLIQMHVYNTNVVD